MDDADLSRRKAVHCRRLAKESDAGTAASLEMLATAYDEDARLTDLQARKNKRRQRPH